MMQRASLIPSGMDAPDQHHKETAIKQKFLAVEHKITFTS